MSTFRNPALKQLTDQQVRFAPPARRQEQMARTERLIAEIDDAKQYPYQFIGYRITDYRPSLYPDLLIGGEDLKHDLGLFLDEIARSLEQHQPAVPADKLPEPMLTLDEISKELNVSTKTIRRWRSRGLIGQRIVSNGRRQLAFPKSAVYEWVADHQTQVERGSRFSHLSDDEREDILRRAKRLARVGGGTLTEVSRRIARRLGRSAETIRYTIKNYDRAHPDQAVFPDILGPLDDQTKQVIYNSYRRGISVDTLCKQFGRTRTSVYRVVNEVRAQRLLSQPLDYIANPSFDDPAAAPVILAPMPDHAEFTAKKEAMRVPKDVPPELAPCYKYPLLTKEQEQHLFRQMNFLKHQASQLRDRLDPARAKISDLKRIEELQDQANAVREQLVNCNMRLVWSIAKRHVAQADNIFELVSDGNMSLLRAVEKFDYARGNKFSTYASWAIMKNFARSIPDEKRHRERYITGNEEIFDAAPDSRSDEQECLATAEQAARKVNRLLEYLDPRERDIIRMRAGLDHSEGPKTLEEIGKHMGITKERVRQLSVRIMRKLETIAREKPEDVL